MIFDIVILFIFLFPFLIFGLWSIISFWLFTLWMLFSILKCKKIAHKMKKMFISMTSELFDKTSND